VFTGLAGALWVPLNGLTTPDIIHWSFSGEMVFMTVLGGFRSFAGPSSARSCSTTSRPTRSATRCTGSSSSGRAGRARALAATGIVGTAGRLAARWKKGAEVSLLVTKNLVKYFGDTHAVDHVDFTVKEREVLALIGSNGAGKTTLVNLISGLFPPDSGRILFRGQDVTRESVHGRIRAGIARSFQLVNLFDQLTVLDNVALTIFSRAARRGGSPRSRAPIAPCGTRRSRSSVSSGSSPRRGCSRAESHRASASSSTSPSRTRSDRSSCSSTSRRAA